MYLLFRSAFSGYPFVLKRRNSTTMMLWKTFLVHAIAIIVMIASAHAFSPDPPKKEVLPRVHRNTPTIFFIPTTAVLGMGAIQATHSMPYMDEVAMALNNGSWPFHASVYAGLAMGTTFFVKLFYKGEWPTYLTTGFLFHLAMILVTGMLSPDSIAHEVVCFTSVMTGWTAGSLIYLVGAYLEE